MSHSPSLHGPGDSERSPHQRPSEPFRKIAIHSGLLDAAALDAAEHELRTRPENKATDPTAWDKALADVLVLRGNLTHFQAEQMLAGHRKLTLGQYRITDAIGQGGMGQVFKAEHAMMGRTVAVKVLPRVKSTPETEAAFQREIRMLGRLDHENLVRALDAGHDGKVYYLVTEFVPGFDLRKQVLKYGTLDEVSAASVITQAAHGLAYAHAQGLVHRDVKPGNMLVTEDGRVKVLDLGLAGSVLEAESTRLGRVVGTMDYMAPEQIRSPDTVGPAADIYSLGCTLYFVLAGQVPFPGGTRQEKARRQQIETPTPIKQFSPHLSDAFCRVLEDMMQKSSEKRIATASEVIQRLRQWMPQSPAAMSRKEKLRPVSNRSRSQPVETKGPPSLGPPSLEGMSGSSIPAFIPPFSSGSSSTLEAGGLFPIFHQSATATQADAYEINVHNTSPISDSRVTRAASLPDVVAQLLMHPLFFRLLQHVRRIVGIAGVFGIGVGAAAALLDSFMPFVIGWLAFFLLFGLQILMAYSTKSDRR